MPQSLLDDQTSPSQDGNEARLHQLEKRVDTLNCELALLRQHMESGFALVRSDMAARFAEADLKSAERFAEAERKNIERFAEAERKNVERFSEARRESEERFNRQDDNMKALICQLQAQMLETDKRHDAHMAEMRRRQDTFGRWMVGLTLSVVILVAHLASRMF